MCPREAEAMTPKKTKGVHYLSVAPPPWETGCKMHGCNHPASPRRTRRMYLSHKGEEWPDDVSERPVCNYHFLIDRCMKSKLFAFVPFIIGVISGLYIPPIGHPPWSFVQIPLIMLFTMIAALFVEGVILLLIDYTVKVTGGGHLGI